MNNQASNAYHHFRSLALDSNKSGHTERALEYIDTAAYIAWKSNIRWKDEQMEELLCDIGEKCAEDSESPSNTSEGRQHDTILYIATSLGDTGGHSDVLRTWSRLIEESELRLNQEVLLTNELGQRSSFPNLRKEMRQNSVKITGFDPDSSYIDRIIKLANKLRHSHYSHVVLFVHPNDVVALSAIYGIKELPGVNMPEILFFNHADHVFWLGTGVIDKLIEFRSVGGAISERYRDITPHSLIPLTTDIDCTHQNVEQLITGDATTSISVGAKYKILPDIGYNYFECINKVLTENRDHNHILVTSGGVKEEIASYIDQSNQQRIQTYKNISDLTPAYASADLLLDTFPYGGGLVKTEAAACGLPIVSLQIPGLPLLSNTDILPEGYSYSAETEKGYINSAQALISDADARRKAGEILKSRFTSQFSPKAVQRNLTTVLTGNGPPEQKYGGDNLQMDLDLYSQLGEQDTVDAELHHLRISSLKNTNSDILNRSRTFARGVSNGEISSPRHGAIHLLLALFGRQGYIFAKQARNYIHSIYR